MNENNKQLEAQRKAAEQAYLTQKPVDDGWGSRWYPPGKDGISTVSRSSSSIRETMSEDEIQAAIFQHVVVRRAPNTLILHIPGNPRSARDGARLKRLGVRAGAPDILVVKDGRALFLEVKTLTGRWSPEQRQFAWDAQQAGAVYMVGYGLDHCLDILKSWGCLIRSA